MRLAWILVAATFHLAHADSPSTIASATTESAPTHTLALATNEPFGWNHANAVGLSAYAAITEHQVIRVNAATWTQGTQDLGATLLFIATQAEVNGSGRYTDVGAAWTYFPRRAYDGASVELGAFVRRRNTFNYHDDFTDDGTTVESTIVAGRALVGWSWLGWHRVFVSLQVGASVGREYGTQTDRVQMDTGGFAYRASSVDRTTISPEGFVRFGVLLNP
jgi:hypothetical protein